MSTERVAKLGVDPAGRIAAVMMGLVFMGNSVL